MDMIWEVYGAPAPVLEYQFHPIRKWRFDYAWPEEKIAVEIEGGIWVRGAHTRGRHFLSDAEKYNHAALLGWRVLRFIPKQLKNGEAQNFMLQVFGNLRLQEMINKK